MGEGCVREQWRVEKGKKLIDLSLLKVQATVNWMKRRGENGGALVAA